MKKTWAVMGTAVAVSAMIFTGCGSSNTTTGTDTTQESENTDTAATDTPAAEDSKGGDFSGLISPISREEGSGTRGAFIELFGIETKDTDGNKIDNTTDTAEITNSTSVMMTTVAGNEYAIGYVSLGSLDDSVKALKIDGAEASVDTVKDGSYKISRPFNIVTKDGLSEVAADFVKYIMSEDGQKVVEDNGYISQGNEGAYEASGLSGKVTVAGSSSVTPVMEKLAESYKCRCGNRSTAERFYHRCYFCHRRNLRYRNGIQRTEGYRDFSGCNRNTDRFGWNRSYREQTEPGR